MADVRPEREERAVTIPSSTSPMDDSRAPVRDGAWSAHDLAEACGRSIGWARQTLVRWTDTHAVAVIGTDAITGARLYSSQQVWAAWRTEQAGAVDAAGLEHATTKPHDRR